MTKKKDGAEMKEILWGLCIADLVDQSDGYVKTDEQTVWNLYLYQLVVFEEPLEVLHLANSSYDEDAYLKHGPP